MPQVGRKEEPPLLLLSGVTKTYGAGRSLLGGKRSRAVQACVDVGLSIRPGESLGLVGESGSGKTTIGRIVAALERPDVGTVAFRQRDYAAMGRGDLRRLHRHIQVIQQDPLASLNPRVPVWRAVTHALRTHRMVSGNNRLRDAATELLERVQLSPAYLDRYPHELSGGQGQRVCVARAIACRPELLVADEPTSALDVSVQADILRLLLSLQRDLDSACLFISHDLRVVRHVTQQVAVMYQGRIVEEGATSDVLGRPQHDYTQKLMDSVPRLHRRRPIRRDTTATANT